MTGNLKSGEQELEAGWIAWHGGENPVPGQMVEVRRRDGFETCPIHPDHVRWSWRDGPDQFDIIAYRVVTPAPAALEGSSSSEGETALLDEIGLTISVMRKGAVRRNGKRSVIVDIEATDAVMQRAADLMEGVTKALVLRCQNDNRPRR